MKRFTIIDRLPFDAISAALVWPIVTLVLMWCSPPISAASEGLLTNLVWGAEVSGSKVGILTQPLPRKPGHPEVELVPAVQITGTNMLSIWLPPEQERYSMTLFDEEGTEVNKTPRGKLLGAPLKLSAAGMKKRGSHLPGLLLPNKPNFPCEPFVLTDYFQVESPGKYKLVFELRFLRRLSRTNIQSIVLPPVTLKVPCYMVPLRDN